ncbi:MAG: tryptophan synthase subunit alpha [Patescibacteria group bacterium]
MNKFSNDRYAKTFEKLKKERRIGFCPFAVLGDPTPKLCLVRIKKYLEAQPDFLELGIPFSDPIADGPTIQAADERALKAGVTPKKAIELVKKIRAMIQQHNRDIPIGILAYSNIVLRYGIQKFYRDLKQAGADSILIADVPLEEIKPFAKAAKKHKIHQIFIVSEYTDNARLKKIEKIASGFLYAVSVLGITGARKELSKSTLDFVRRLKTKTRLPIMVGFGISSRDHINALQKAGANGAIIGSALVKTPTFKLPQILKNLRG